MHQYKWIKSSERKSIRKLQLAWTHGYKAAEVHVNSQAVALCFLNGGWWGVSHVKTYRED